MHMTKTNKQFIQSLDRGLQILESICEQDRPVRLGQMAELLGVEKSSAYRLVSTLAERGYVCQDPSTGGYVPHEKLFDLAGRTGSRRRIQEYARKHLRRLAQETGETAHIGVRRMDKVVFIDHEFSRQPVAVICQYGDAEPLHCTALGKSLLAGLTEPELRLILGPEPLKKFTIRTITQYAHLVRQCRQAETSLLSEDNEEYRPGVRCLASPIFDIRGQVIAAIGISGPVERITDRTAAAAGQLVRQCAWELSREMGYREAERNTATGT
jgi:DNA-binding IclR family transcriptional regulator